MRIIIAWKAYRAALTLLSSTEGEYLAATKAAVEILASQATNGKFLGVDLKPPTTMFNDNKSAVMLADSNTSSKRMKHIATRIAFLREQISEGTIMLLRGVCLSPQVPLVFCLNKLLSHALDGGGGVRSIKYIVSMRVVRREHPSGSPSLILTLTTQRTLTVGVQLHLNSIALSSAASA